MSSLQRLTPGPNIQPFYVVGYDPGGTTGWAVAEWFPDDLFRSNEGPQSMSDIRLTVGEFANTPEGHYSQLYKHMGDHYVTSAGDVEFVSEPFTYRQFANKSGEDGVSRGKVELISAEYIGVMKLVAQDLNRPLYFGFNAGQAKAYVTNEKLEKMGWLQKPQHPNRHKNDALRQVVKYLVVKKHIKHPITTAWMEGNS